MNIKREITNVLDINQLAERKENKLIDAIKAGKKDFNNLTYGNSVTEEAYIRDAVAEFIWLTFHKVDMDDPVAVLDTIKKITD